MNKFLIILTLASVASCSSPGVSKLGPNTYLASETSAAGMFVNMSKLKAKTISKANDFAESKGMEAEGIDIKENKPVVAGLPSVDYQFRLVGAGQIASGMGIEQSRQAY
jgi:hypothetical protein